MKGPGTAAGQPRALFALKPGTGPRDTPAWRILTPDEAELAVTDHAQRPSRGGVSAGHGDHAP
jgi:hypothetical protein